MPDTVLFDRYRLLERAGAGGSAHVWRAIDKTTGDVVAVKRLHPVVLADPAARRRLERESRVLQGLTHPNIVALRDVQIDEDEAAIILDYVDGRSLAERLTDGPLPTGEAMAIVRDVASALRSAHAAGVVHRDVKPANIVLAVDGRALLTDFGVSASAADEAGPAGAAEVTDGGALTATGTMVGTLRYMAPEQLRGTPASPASDQYALAAVAYEMLGGRPPYSAATPVALAEAQAEPPPAIEGVREELDAAVRRGLARDPEDRHPDVAAFMAAVTSSVRAAPSMVDTEVVPIVAATASGMQREPAVAAPAVVSAAASAMPTPHRSDRRNVLGVVAGLAALLVGGAVVLGSLGAGGANPSADPGAGLGTPAVTPTPAATRAPEEAQPAANPDTGKPDKPDKPEKPDKPDKGGGNEGRGGD